MLFYDFGVEHDGVGRCFFTLVEEGDDALADAYHIGCHTDAGFLARDEGVEEICGGLEVGGGGGGGFFGE